MIEDESRTAPELRTELERLNRMFITHTVGSCDCGTKSSILHYHTQDCQYRFLREAWVALRQAMPYVK